jgi:hypothetical protein
MTLRAVLLVLYLLALGSAAHASDCKLACKEEPCELSCKGKPCAPTAQGQPVPGKWLFARQCDLLEVVKGTVELRYMHKSRWFMPPAQSKGKPLAAVFSSYPADACAVLSPQCVQTAMSAKQAAVGGHGIDNRVSKPGGEGDPCALGLPCGSVLPSAEAMLPLALVDKMLQGRLSLRVSRGQPPAGMAAETQIAVQGGRASLDGRWLQPGGLYSYQLSDAGGRPLASGEFSLLSQSMAERVRKRAVQREEQQGLSAAQAWYDTLLENQLWWDALQLDLGSES